jgi:benzoate/toluate 1,2-dioxygenase alpha subunit
MPKFTSDEIRALVREDRVHKSVFLDPELFEIEMERVFGRTWIFVGHESQVPEIGDFFATRIGLHSVVMVRHTDRSIRVLYNRCAHRGSRVVNEESGNAKRFRCLYHGWMYHTDGRLAAAPLPNDYRADCEVKNPNFGMLPIARVETYRGFVFGALSRRVPDLAEHLGPARQGLDDFVDAAPEGEIEFAGGFHRYSYAGNWKHQSENLVDTYHTVATHASTLSPDGQQFHRRTGKSGGVAKFIDAGGAPVILDLGVETYPNGHSGTESLISEEASGGIIDEYRALLVARYGEERTKQLMKQRLHNISYYPNLDVLFVQTAVRVILPVSVNETEVRVFPVRLKGAPAQMFRDQIKYLNLTHSASSFVQSDDLEAFLRQQEGLGASPAEWCLVARGLDSERHSNLGVGFGARSSEIGQRHLQRTWLNLMCEEP